MIPILDDVWPNRDDQNHSMFSTALDAAQTSARNGVTGTNTFFSNGIKSNFVLPMYTDASTTGQAKVTAELSKLIPNYPDIGTSITMLAGSITLAKRGLFESDGLPPNTEHWTLIENIATVFAKTSETAFAPPNQSHEIAIEGFAWAQEVASNNQRLIHQMQRELESLFQCSLAWKNKTAVEWDGRQWVGRTPSSWWNPFARNGE